MEELKIMLEMKMDNAFNALLKHYSKTRTGRANASSLDEIRVDYYGANTPIKQLCNITIPEPRLVVIQPWDKSILSEIEKAILSSNIGVTPENDGNVLRLPFRPLTEEIRREIVRQIKTMTEESKIEIRNIRRDGNDSARKMEKNGDISEDDQKKLLKDIQELTDKWIDKISDASITKEREIMEI